MVIFCWGITRRSSTHDRKIYLDLERTKVYWLNWTNRTPTYTKYNDEITRSAITLKLLSYDKSGAVLAAATTSLPETIGEVRNLGLSVLLDQGCLHGDQGHGRFGP